MHWGTTTKKKKEKKYQENPKTKHNLVVPTGINGIDESRQIPLKCVSKEFMDHPEYYMLLKNTLLLENTFR